MGPIIYFPSEGRRAEDFYRPIKIRRLRPGLNPRTWVSEAYQMIIYLIIPALPPMVQCTLGGQGHLIIEASRSHSDTQQSVGLLWTSDQLVAETST
jgi:hypothetical protein